MLVYRSQSLLGPSIGLAVQALWIAYAVATRQWWFLLSAFTYGGANLYGMAKRRQDQRKAVDVTAVKPGQLEEMRAAGTEPSPSFRAAIERARARGDGRHDGRP